MFGAAVTDGSKIIFDPNSIFVPDIFTREAVNMALRALPHDDLSFLQVQPMENSRIWLEMETGSVVGIEYGEPSAYQSLPLLAGHGTVPFR